MGEFERNAGRGMRTGRWGGTSRGTGRNRGRTARGNFGGNFNNFTSSGEKNQCQPAPAPPPPPMGIKVTGEHPLGDRSGGTGQGHQALTDRQNQDPQDQGDCVELFHGDVKLRQDQENYSHRSQRFGCSPKQKNKSKHVLGEGSHNKHKMIPPKVDRYKEAGFEKTWKPLLAQRQRYKPSLGLHDQHDSPTPQGSTTHGGHEAGADRGKHRVLPHKNTEEKSLPQQTKPSRGRRKSTGEENAPDAESSRHYSKHGRSSKFYSKHPLRDHSGGTGQGHQALTDKQNQDPNDQVDCEELFHGDDELSQDGENHSHRSHRFGRSSKYGNKPEYGSIESSDNEHEVIKPPKVERCSEAASSEGKSYLAQRQRHKPSLGVHNRSSSPTSQSSKKSHGHDIGGQGDKDGVVPQKNDKCLSERTKPARGRRKSTGEESQPDAESSRQDTKSPEETSCKRPVRSMPVGMSKIFLRRLNEAMRQPESHASPIDGRNTPAILRSETNGQHGADPKGGASGRKTPSSSRSSPCVPFVSAVVSEEPAVDPASAKSISQKKQRQPEKVPCSAWSQNDDDCRSDSHSGVHGSKAGITQNAPMLHSDNVGAGSENKSHPVPGKCKADMQTTPELANLNLKTDSGCRAVRDYSCSREEVESLTGSEVCSSGWADKSELCRVSVRSNPDNESLAGQQSVIPNADSRSVLCQQDVKSEADLTNRNPTPYSKNFGSASALCNQTSDSRVLSTPENTPSKKKKKKQPRRKNRSPNDKTANNQPGITSAGPKQKLGFNDDSSFTKPGGTRNDEMKYWQCNENSPNQRQTKSSGRTEQQKGKLSTDAAQGTSNRVKECGGAISQDSGGTIWSTSSATGGTSTCRDKGNVDCKLSSSPPYTCVRLPSGKYVVDGSCKQRQSDSGGRTSDRADRSGRDKVQSNSVGRTSNSTDSAACYKKAQYDNDGRTINRTDSAVCYKSEQSNSRGTGSNSAHNSTRYNKGRSDSGRRSSNSAADAVCNNKGWADSRGRTSNSADNSTRYNEGESNSGGRTANNANNSTRYNKRWGDRRGRSSKSAGNSTSYNKQWYDSGDRSWNSAADTSSYDAVEYGRCHEARQSSIPCSESWDVSDDEGPDEPSGCGTLNVSHVIKPSYDNDRVHELQGEGNVLKQGACTVIQHQVRADLGADRTLKPSSKHEDSHVPSAQSDIQQPTASSHRKPYNTCQTVSYGASSPQHSDSRRTFADPLPAPPHQCPSRPDLAGSLTGHSEDHGQTVALVRNQASTHIKQCKVDNFLNLPSVKQKIDALYPKLDSQGPSLSVQERQSVCGCLPSVNESPFSGHENPSSVNESPSSGQASPPSMNESPSSVQECPPSVTESLSSGQESLPSVNDSPTSEQENPSSVNESPSSGQETPSTVNESPTLEQENPSSVNESPSSGQETPSTVNESPTSEQENPSSVNESPSSGQENPSSVNESPSSGQECLSSLNESLSSGQETPSSVNESPSSGQETLSSVNESPSSGQETLSSVNESPSSGQECQSLGDRHQLSLSKHPPTSDIHPGSFCKPTSHRWGTQRHNRSCGGTDSTTRSWKQTGGHVSLAVCDDSRVGSTVQTEEKGGVDTSDIPRSRRNSSPQSSPVSDRPRSVNISNQGDTRAYGGCISQNGRSREVPHDDVPMCYSSDEDRGFPGHQARESHMVSPGCGSLPYPNDHAMTSPNYGTSPQWTGKGNDSVNFQALAVNAPPAPPPPNRGMQNNGRDINASHQNKRKQCDSEPGQKRRGPYIRHAGNFSDYEDQMNTKQTSPNPPVSPGKKSWHSQLPPRLQRKIGESYHGHASYSHQNQSQRGNPCDPRVYPRNFQRGKPDHSQRGNLRHFQRGGLQDFQRGYVRGANMTSRNNYQGYGPRGHRNQSQWGNPQWGHPNMLQEHNMEYDEANMSECSTYKPPLVPSVDLPEYKPPLEPSADLPAYQPPPVPSPDHPEYKTNPARRGVTQTDNESCSENGSEDFEYGGENIPDSPSAFADGYEDLLLSESFVVKTKKSDINANSAVTDTGPETSTGKVVDVATTTDSLCEVRTETGETVDGNVNSNCPQTDTESQKDMGNAANTPDGPAQSVPSEVDGNKAVGADIDGDRCQQIITTQTVRSTVDTAYPDAAYILEAPSTDISEARDPEIARMIADLFDGEEEYEYDESDDPGSAGCHEQKPTKCDKQEYTPPYTGGAPSIYGQSDMYLGRKETEPQTNPQLGSGAGRQGSGGVGSDMTTWHRPKIIDFPAPSYPGEDTWRRPPVPPQSGEIPRESTAPYTQCVQENSPHVVSATGGQGSGGVDSKMAGVIPWRHPQKIDVPNLYFSTEEDRRWPPVSLPSESGEMIPSNESWSAEIKGQNYTLFCEPMKGTNFNTVSQQEYGTADKYAGIAEPVNESSDGGEMKMESVNTDSSDTRKVFQRSKGVDAQTDRERIDFPGPSYTGAEPWQQWEVPVPPQSVLNLPPSGEIRCDESWSPDIKGRDYTPLAEPVRRMDRYNISHRVLFGATQEYGRTATPVHQTLHGEETTVDNLNGVSSDNGNVYEGSVSEGVDAQTDREGSPAADNNRRVVNVTNSERDCEVLVSDKRKVMRRTQSDSILAGKEANNKTTPDRPAFQKKMAQNGTELILTAKEPPNQRRNNTSNRVRRSADCGLGLGATMERLKNSAGSFKGNQLPVSCGNSQNSPSQPDWFDCPNYDQPNTGFVFTPPSSNNYSVALKKNQFSVLASFDDNSSATDSDVSPSVNQKAWRRHTRWSDPPPRTDCTTQEEEQPWQRDFRNYYNRLQTMYFDTHCHIDFIFKRLQFEGSYEKYRLVNKWTYPDTYAGCLAVFCDPRTFRKQGVWKDILADPTVWGAVGCHPKSATEFDCGARQGLVDMLKDKKVKAVGEIGLDYSGTFHQHRDKQIEVFRDQIQIAIDINFPIVIHCRDAEEDCLRILCEMVPSTYRIHRHCFTGCWAEAEEWLRHFPESYIGLTPLITFSGGRSIAPREVARHIPLERLLLETDSPYFVPKKVPREAMALSHPGMAVTVAEEVARLKGIDTEEVLTHCLHNSETMYGITINKTRGAHWSTQAQQ